MARAEANWERLVRAALRGERMGGGYGVPASGIAGNVPTSLGNNTHIDEVLRAADEIQDEDPTFARILGACALAQNYAYALAQNLDPNSEGRGVLQFRTGLLSVIRELHAHGGLLGMPTAEDGTPVYWNAGGGSSVSVVAPVAIERNFSLLWQPYYSMGALSTRAPQSSQDGVVGHLVHIPSFGANARNQHVIDIPRLIRTPYFGGGALTDFPLGDGGTRYWASRALTVPHLYPARDGGTPYLARRALTDSPLGDGEASYLGGGALTVSVGANARNQHVIDIPPPLPDATTGTTDQARKFLERLLFGILPACVVALVPLTGAPDGTKLAIYIILAVLVVLLVIGISTRAYAERVVRLATCAGIFAMTVFVSIQFSRGIYVAIAALVGVALSGITLAV